MSTHESGFSTAGERPGQASFFKEKTVEQTLYFSGADGIIKVSGKTSGLEPGDESEHLILLFSPVFRSLLLFIVLVCGIIDSWIS